MHATTSHPYEAHALFAITVAASRRKVKLPGLTGNMSVNLPFLLLAAAELNPVEAITIAVVSTAVQCFPKDGTKPTFVRVLFNFGLMSSAIALAGQVFRMGAAAHPILVHRSVGIALGRVEFVPDADRAGRDRHRLHRRRPVTAIWTKIARMTFPYYVLSAGMASMMMAARQHVGWQVPLLALPIMYGRYRSYQVYFGREPQTRSLTVWPKPRPRDTERGSLRKVLAAVL